MRIQEISLALQDSKGRVEGFCTEQYRPLLDAFINNFEHRGELGASVVVTHEGETVVDLWGGYAVEDKSKTWQKDTVCQVWSSTKGITALVANMLIDQALLDPDQPVAEIWPEFASHGKEHATVRMMLDHTVGVPVLRETVKPGGFLDWDYMCDLLAAQQPYWEPGSKQGYHGVTYAWTVGELIRRITGKSVGTNIQQMLSIPLGLDLWCGLPDSAEARVAPVISPQAGEQSNAMIQLAMTDLESIPAKFMLNDGGWVTGATDASFAQDLTFESRSSHKAEIPSANGMTNARGLAGAYRPFAIGGSLNGVKFVGSDTLAGMEDISAGSHLDQTLRIPTAWSLGFSKRANTRLDYNHPQEGILEGRRAFCHGGAGGSIGLADPEAGMSFGYTMNRMGQGLVLTERTQTLLNEAYKAIGYRLNSAGNWVL